MYHFRTALLCCSDLLSKQKEQVHLQIEFRKKMYRLLNPTFNLPTWLLYGQQQSLDQNLERFQMFFSENCINDQNNLSKTAMDAKRNGMSFKICPVTPTKRHKYSQRMALYSVACLKQLLILKLLQTYYQSNKTVRQINTASDAGRKIDVQEKNTNKRRLKES